MIEIPVSNASWPPGSDTPSEAPERPFRTSMTMSYDILMTKDMRKYLREMARARPNLKHPQRKCAWRLVRKWFNRYQKPRMIGMIVVAQTKDGKNYPMKTHDVKIRKGYPGVLYQYSCTPQL